MGELVAGYLRGQEDVALWFSVMSDHDRQEGADRKVQEI